MSSETLARPEDDEVQLAHLLEAIANPTRLALLRQLRDGPLLSEIRIRAEQARAGLPEDRPMARQGVRLHLDRLIDAGFARQRQAWRGEDEVQEFIVHHARLFALAEEIRQLGALRPRDLAVSAETTDLDGAAPPQLPAGRSLVVVHGLNEGRSFPLTTGSSWTIGRQWDLPIPLDYDPYVSATHARIFLDGERAMIEPAAQSRNGTFVNWAPVRDGRPVALRHGDIIGVGKSLLLFRA